MPHTRPFRPLHARSAFTLVEMMVVIAVIVILVSITLGVASAVVEGGRKRATEGVLRALDQTMDIYIDKNGEIPPAWVEMPFDGGQRYMYFPLFDGVVRRSDGAPIEFSDSSAYYLHAANKVPEIQSIIAGLDSRFIRVTGIRETGDEEVAFELTGILDAWGNPVRMVHPRFDGLIKGDSQFATLDIITDIDRDGFVSLAEVRALSSAQLDGKVFFRQIRRLAPTRNEWRNFDAVTITQNFANGVGDSDGGACPSPRPYFYSAGPDGDPSTIDDNVYTTRPRFPEPE